MLDTVKTLFEKGKYQEIIDKTTKFTIKNEKSSLSDENQIEFTLYHCFSLIALGYYKRGLELAKSVREKHSPPKNLNLYLGLLSVEIEALLELGHMGELKSLNAKEKILLKKNSIEKQGKQSFWIHRLTLSIGYYLMATGKLNRSFHYYNKALSGFKRFDVPNFVAKTYDLIGRLFYRKSENKRALEYYQKALNQYEKLGNKSGISSVLLSIGHIYFARGEHKQKLEYYKRSLAYAQSADNPVLTAWALNIVGWSYVHLSKHDAALEHCKKALTLAEPTGGVTLNSEISIVLGWLYHILGDSINSELYLKRALTLREQLGKDQGLIPIWFLIRLMLDHNKLTQAKKYLATLHKIYTRAPSFYVRNYFQCAKALILKKSPRITDKAQAQIIFKQLVTEEFFRRRWPITMMCLFHLCELLVFEVKATSEIEAWEETKVFFNQFYTRSQENKDLFYFGEAILLKAKITMIEGKLQDTFNLLASAIKFVTETDNNILKKQAEAEQTQLQTDLELWNDLIRTNASLQRRLHQAQIEEYLQKVTQLVSHRT
jgi:tetratricopeptide (TPR) repeat protein